jgi:membrane dipeptidase
VRRQGDSSFDKLDIAQRQPKLHTDIERLRRGGVDAQFWAAYAPVETAKRGEAAQYTLEQIDLIRRMIDRYPETFELATSADDITRIVSQGKIASLIGVEGGHSIQNSLGVLRMFHSLGVRYMTLTHSDTLDWADAATDQARSAGLSPFGEEVVRTMNALGMLVDISHVSAETMRDALRVSRAPVIASHSSAYAVAQHPRNVPDDVLKLVAENGGVVMVNFYSGFVVPESARTMAKMFDVRRELREKYPNDAEFEKAQEKWRRENPISPGSVRTVVDHIDHIVKTAGIDHAGLGSDFDGITMVPRQLEDVSCYPYITQELLNRGYSREDIHKVLGGNFLRAFRQAEEAARKGRVQHKTPLGSPDSEAD